MDFPKSWVFIIEENNVRENSLNVVFPNGLPLLLIKKEGRYFGLSNKCAHMACGMESGTLKDYTLQVPVMTGSTISGQGRFWIRQKLKFQFMN